MKMSDLGIAAALDPATGTAERSIGLWAMLRDDVRCVFNRDPAARNTLELLTIYPGIHALVAHRIAHRL